MKRSLIGHNRRHQIVKVAAEIREAAQKVPSNVTSASNARVSFDDLAWWAYRLETALGVK